MLRVCTASLSSTVTAMRMKERALYTNPHQIRINNHHIIQKIQAVGFSSGSLNFVHATPPVLDSGVNQGVCNPDIIKPHKAKLIPDLNHAIITPTEQNIVVDSIADQKHNEYTPTVNKDGFENIAVDVSNAEETQVSLDNNLEAIVNADAGLNEEIESKIVQNVNSVAETVNEEIVVETVDDGAVESAAVELTLDDPNILWRDQTANRAYLYSTPAARSLLFI